MGVLVSAIIVATALVVLAPLTSGQRRAEKVTQSDLSIQRQAAALRATLVRWQQVIEPHFDEYQAGATNLAVADLATGALLATTQVKQAAILSTALRASGFSREAQDLSTAAKVFNDSIAGLRPMSSPPRLNEAQFTKIVATERAAYSGVWEIASAVNQDETTHTTAPDVEYVTGQISAARTIVVVAGSLLVLLALCGAGIVARRAARGRRAQDLSAQRQRYATELQQALELSPTEDAVYSVVGRALREAEPQLNVELLIADSSNAHFRQVLTNNRDPGHEGCGVVSPRDCPASIRGHTMEFASSDAISACPYLQNRESGSCSAVCMPVSISGSTVGVMHATGPDGTLPAAGDVENLELSARRGAERVALLRAFAKSETQAHTDPLTGLLNRRSLENQVRELQLEGTPYALAYGDLDFFKTLNDTHGHEAGDRALRLFSRVMRDAVRPADLVSRYGGEEFVIVLPDCGTDAAVVVLERVRERLALALMSGRIPAFTVSFGVATSADATTFDEIVAAADQALLAAKASGRDRVLLANSGITAS